ncbi:hypothetical protein GUITHDRAFT_146401 [Guillardia theta CCMP2712]|uniref:PA14 domain-containing protein n=1 Tax=Guillardia theta (strain CCMP2712) TaxID=905079 RepID=L1II02_GUITC|nr:hypothetical protein GUITHDRAFT_146401 [Guillardia theta CCMP2712]EKX35574.1 hypothetical protein GUITHDRAFT_146401 [Guillardia theta CCMP2712]|eukprot:XP_005822554.1 hypothetical protein GUITHDRAFT_146401 [Guillardia theta CCMP2712]
MTSRSSHVLLITLVLPDGGTSAKRIRPLVAVGSTVLAILLVSLLIATSASLKQKMLALRQMLENAYVEYNSQSGLLVTRHFDDGFKLLVWWNADVRYDQKNLVKLFKPEAEGTTKYINFVNYSSIQEKLLKGDTFPPEGSDDLDDLVVLMVGQVKVPADGDYTIFLNTTGGAVINVTDSKTGASVELSGVSEGVESGVVTLSEGMATVVAFWHPSADGVSVPRLIVTWNGTGTGGEVPLVGRHWTDGKSTKPKGESTGGVKEEENLTWRGQFQTGSPIVELPPAHQLLNETPCAAVRLDTINISSHDELWSIVREEGEEDFLSYHVAAVCQGLVKTEHAGRYQFDVASDDGASLIIDDILVLNETGEVDPFVVTSALVKLPAGYHEVTLTWFQNSVQGPTQAGTANSRYEKQTGGQVLVLLYRGPDNHYNVNLSDPMGPELSSGGRIVLIPPPQNPAQITYSGNGPLIWSPAASDYSLLTQGFFLPGGFGDIKGLKLTGGRTVHGRLLGYSASNGKFRKERNPLESFDKKWYSKNKNKEWRKYDYHGKDYDDEISSKADSIIKPWTDHSKAAYEYGHNPNKRLQVPDSVYTQDPPYDMNVVDIGGKGIQWQHNEGSIGDDVKTINGESSVIGRTGSRTAGGEDEKEGDNDKAGGGGEGEEEDEDEAIGGRGRRRRIS